MSLARLRSVLQKTLTVNVESTADLANRVNAAAQARLHLHPKPASAYQPLLGTQPLNFRSLDFLRKIGELTTPKKINLARLSASWATRRYFWAIHTSNLAPTATERFRLSKDARNMDRHQKTLLSDEFGMGFAGLVAERLLQVDDFVDVEFATSNSTQYFGATGSTTTKRRPDFLMWGVQTPIFIIECKGSQTTLGSVIAQLRRGLEQLPSIQIPTLQSVSLVVATYLRGRDTTVMVLDPPEEQDNPEREIRKVAVDETISRDSEGGYIVDDLIKFREKLSAGADIMRLRWAGQHASAGIIEQRLGRKDPGADLPNAPLERLRTPVADYLGTATPLAPELGRGGPVLFRGISETSLLEMDAGANAANIPGEPEAVLTVDDPRVSTGALGTCLAIYNLEI
jgi:hypothetical protein